MSYEKEDSSSFMQNVLTICFIIVVSPIVLVGVVICLIYEQLDKNKIDKL